VPPCLGTTAVTCLLYRLPRLHSVESYGDGFTINWKEFRRENLYTNSEIIPTFTWRDRVNVRKALFKVGGVADEIGPLVYEY
jgi:hypothetical protein